MQRHCLQVDRVVHREMLLHGGEPLGDAGRDGRLDPGRGGHGRGIVNREAARHAGLEKGESIADHEVVAGPALDRVVADRHHVVRPPSGRP